MSRKRLFAAMVLSAMAVLVVSAVVRAAPSIDWGYDYDKAVKDAQASNKPVLIDFYTDWCGWCKKLDSDTYSDKRVVELSHKFVCVKVDAEKYSAVAEAHKVEGFPTIVFLNSKAREISRVVGYRNAKQFLSAMNVALKKAE